MMDDIFDYKFTFEQKVKDEVIDLFSDKQGGQFGVFSYQWQCFVWAATIGFMKDLRKPLGSPQADKPFNLNTMIHTNGEKDARALICMCVARAGSIDILKDPEAAISLINEYANGGFYWIMQRMKDNPVYNGFEWVKQEVFSRDPVVNIEITY